MGVYVSCFKRGGVVDVSTLLGFMLYGGCGWKSVSEFLGVRVYGLVSVEIALVDLALNALLLGRLTVFGAARPRGEGIYHSLYS